MNTDQYITELFVGAGWHEGRKLETNAQSLSSTNAACINVVRVLIEYGGLKVGEVGAGQETSSSDIVFRTEALDFGKEFHNYWRHLKYILICLCICTS